MRKFPKGPKWLTVQPTEEAFQAFVERHRSPMGKQRGQQSTPGCTTWFDGKMQHFASKYRRTHAPIPPATDPWVEIVYQVREDFAHDLAV